MRVWIGAGLVCVLGAVAPNGVDARPGPPPVILAQLKLNAPSPDTLTKPGAIVTALQATDVAAFFKESGVTDVAISRDEKMQVVEGNYKGAQIIASLGSRTEAVNGGVILIAYLGKQEAVDQTFMNAFNKNYFVRLLKREDGTIILKLAADFTNGVTIEYCKGFVQSFVESIDSAAQYKVD